jgi:peptide chain release factor subunit 1
MAVTVLGVGTLRRLSQLASDGQPLLSVYLDLDTSRFPTPPAREMELSAVLSHVDALEADVDRVRQLLETRPELVQGARGLAIFSSVATGALETVSLPWPVEPMAVVDTVPWLEPLAAMVTRERWGVAVVSRRAARLFRGGPHSLVEFSTVDDEVHRRHAQGGRSQSRFQRAIEQQVAEHVRHTAQRLLRAHRSHPFGHVVVVASHELWPLVQASLDADLRALVAGHVAIDLEHAPPEQIAQAVAPIIEQVESRREQELLERLEEALATGGPAVAGLDEVLAVLEQQRVEVLVVAAGANLTAGLCPRCRRLSTLGDGRCRLDRAVLGRVNAIEHALELAARQSAEIAVLTESPTLQQYGSIAALLHW